MPLVRVSDIAKDYLEYRQECSEHGSLDSALREVIRDDGDGNWRSKAKEYRAEREGESDTEE